MKLELIKHPSDWLTKKIDPWDFDNPPMDPIELKNEMFKIMKANLGIGLSANQVGINARCFVFIINNNTNNQLDREILCLNPEIVENIEPVVTMWEGCLSFPNYFVKVRRPKEILATWYDENLEQKKSKIEGYTTKVFLHEWDHLQGVTFKDRVSKMKWDMAKKKAIKLRKKYA